MYARINITRGKAMIVDSKNFNLGSPSEVNCTKDDYIFIELRKSANTFRDYISLERDTNRKRFCLEGYYNQDSRNMRFLKAKNIIDACIEAGWINRENVPHETIE